MQPLHCLGPSHTDASPSVFVGSSFCTCASTHCSQYSYRLLHHMPAVAPSPSCSSPPRNPMLSHASPIFQQRTVHRLALMPNPDRSQSSIAVSRCDNTVLVKQVWQSACCAIPGARPNSSLSIIPSYPPCSSPCLSWGLGGSWCYPSQISASHKGLSTSSPCLGFAVTSPDASISQFQSTRGWWDLALFFACKLCTSSTRRKEKRRRDECGCFCRLFAGFLLQRVCSQELQHVSTDKHMEE